MTGISGSGKSTLCEALNDILKQSVPELVVLDGDVIRAAFGGDLGYEESDRVIQIQRLQGLAKALSEQQMVVLVAALYAHDDLLAWNREHMTEYFEVFLNAPLTLVQSRDPKGLYAKAANGEMPNVVGVDIPWNTPRNPDMEIDATSEEPPRELALRIIDAVPVLANRLKKAAHG